MKDKLVTQEERLEKLIKQLCEDSVQYKNMKVEPGERRRVMRSLMNVRMPKPISKEFLKVQDEFLQEEAREKGIVSLQDIPTLKEDYGLEGDFSDKLSIWQGDITRLQVDAIVNAANSQMLGCFVPCHGCIDNAIHSAAGVELREECYAYMQEKKKLDSFYKEPTGSAVITKGYNLPCKYVIHTVGPIVGGKLTEALRNDLRSCYESCLHKAVENKVRSIAFCCISTGEFHFPNETAAGIAIETVKKCLSEHYEVFDRIIFNVFKEEDLRLYKKQLKVYS